MNVTTTTVNAFCAPSAAWTASNRAGASLIGINALPLSVQGTRVAKHAQKRFTMTGTDTYGWPLGPRDGTSG